MLDEFITSLPGAVQVSLAIDLIKRILPVWNSHMQQRPGDLDAVNALIDDAHRVQNGAEILYPGLLDEIVSVIERALATGNDLKQDRILGCFLATLMQPLSNQSWDGTLTPPVRLVFTSVYNLLVALTYRRLTPDNETHIYVAINQACDAILQEGLLSAEELEAVLQAHAGHTPRTGRDPLVQEGDASFDTGPDVYSRFLNAVKREHARCPRCGSTRVLGTAVGIEFTRMQCNSCGNDDLMDEYQLDEWYV